MSGLQFKCGSSATVSPEEQHPGVGRAVQGCRVIDKGDPIPLEALTAVNVLFLITVDHVPARCQKRRGEKRRRNVAAQNQTLSLAAKYCQ